MEWQSHHRTQPHHHEQKWKIKKTEKKSVVNGAYSISTINAVA